MTNPSWQELSEDDYHEIANTCESPFEIIQETEKRLTQLNQYIVSYFTTNKEA